ncbi:MAG: DUF3830 family protein [Chloroflexota bacterium]|nr:DUF3830 family protein [Chloroflexota bacterium]MDE3193655.1 DUF3830 family protein [Chloroflexota bacterium]
MRRVTVELEDLAIPVRLDDAAAPVTCERLRSRLPYEDMFTHSIWSGLLIHSNRHPQLDLDVSRYPLVENPVGFIAPGDVVVWPQNGTLAIAYGPTQFKWLTGPWIVTKVGEIEGDVEPFARAAYRMMFEGARRVRIHDGASAPLVREVRPTGKLVDIDYDGMTWTAELLEDQAPEYCQAVWDALPLQGQTSITHSSGEVLHFWCSVPEPAKKPSTALPIIPVEYRGTKVGVTSVAFDPLSMRGHHPGDLIWGSTWNGIRIVYGQGRFGTGGKFGRIVRGDLATLAAKAARVPWDGSKVMTMRRSSAKV